MEEGGWLEELTRLGFKKTIWCEVGSVSCSEQRCSPNVVEGNFKAQSSLAGFLLISFMELRGPETWEGVQK